MWANMQQRNENFSEMPVLQTAGRPQIFIGSSSESLPVAKAIQANLDMTAACTIWTQGVFGLSVSNIENLIDAANNFDFAVLIASSDDMRYKGGSNGYVPRDNVIFEIGLFLGMLGRRRTFIVYDRDRKPKLPSDLDGVCTATYSRDGHSSLLPALGAACTQIEAAILVQNS